MRPEQSRTYDRTSSVVFLKTDELFGGLSNMAGGFPLYVNEMRVLTSEALYQACRFPHRPEVQRLIIEQKSPMTAKMKSKPYRRDSRQDWDQVRVRIMRWCLRVKLAQNWRKFSELLLGTGARPIVEESRKDGFWGAKAADNDTLVGMNVLGRLLMELREAVKAESRESFVRVPPIAIPEFLLDGRSIGIITAMDTERAAPRVEAETMPLRGDVGGPPAAPSLFDGATVKKAPAPACWGVNATGIRISDLKPYRDYKESGLPWFGQIPGHWGQRRMKFLFKERVQKGFPNEPLLAATQSKGVVRKEDYGARTVTAIKDLHLLKLAEEGDFVISLRSFQGGIEITHARGIISPAYTILAPRRDAIRGYYARFFKSPDFIGSLTLFVTGIREGQNIDYERLSRAYLPLPPPEDQHAVGRFLDWASARLQRGIRAKRKVIALLNDQKRAIVHRAVTRGLDPSVPLKPSGIPWLGDVPTHWEVSRVKNEFRCLNTRRVPLNAVERGAMTSRTYDYYGASGVIDKVDDYLFDEELLLIAEDGANLVLRNLPLAIVASGRFWVNNHAHILRPKRGNIVYLAHLLETLDYSPWISGAAQPKLTQDRLMSISIAVAPPAEQDAIVRHASEQARPLISAISRLDREIELLREYSTRLVSDVVTGKLDVRKAATRLRDEAPAESADRDADMGDETETADDEAAA